jgi:transcriptional regulator with AAA-type ATPase domain
MQHSILLENLNTQTLKELIKDGVKSQLEDFKKEFHSLNTKEDLLNRQQVLELLNINATTLWHYQNKGKIPFYKFANKCYYKRSEIMNSLIPVKK